MRVEVGGKIYLKDEKRPYYVQARDKRFIICTKGVPYHKVKYFIIDLADKLRGPDNQVLCAGYVTREQCKERLKELENGEIELSRKQSVPVDGVLFNPRSGKICMTT